MKKTMLMGLVVVIALGSGCAFQGYPMQRGEKVIFSSAERAQAYREWSGNDAWNTGKVVTVTGAASIKRW